MTCTDIAEKLGIKRDTAYAFVQVLVELGLAEGCGTRPREGSGKRENVYKIEEDVADRLAEIVRNKLIGE